MIEKTNHLEIQASKIAGVQAVLRYAWQGWRPYRTAGIFYYRTNTGR